MKTIYDLVQLAKINNGLKTDKELSKKMGITPPSLHNAIVGKTKLKQKNLFSLLDFSGVSEEDRARVVFKYYSRNCPIDNMLDYDNLSISGRFVIIPHKNLTIKG